MHKKLSTCNFTQTPSLKKQEGKSEGFLGICRAFFVSKVLLFLCLSTPGAGWAQENFFQIINDTTTAVNPDFVSNRGYTVYVSYEGKKFLMDTGISKTSFVKNMKAAGVSLENLDFVFLSHRHRDHTGGLDHILSKRPSLRVYRPPGDSSFWRTRFKDKGLIEVDDHLKVTSNIFLIHTHDELGSAGVKDELSLLILTKKGPYVFTTNSHTDFFAKLEKAKRLAGQDIFFHSGHTARRVSSEETITANARKLKVLNVRQVSPSHSSPSHDRIFKEAFGANYVAARVGQKVTLEPASK